MALLNFLKRTFTWWHDATWGTTLFTWRKGELVGDDAAGNRYYRERGGSRRWVMYSGDIEASRIPPEWHAWLHYTVADPPSEKPPLVKSWEKPHHPNLTGSAEAYVPAGSLATATPRAATTGDYEAWRP
jgi:NADH:ubiquinone oxidoreductase subunit